MNETETHPLPPFLPENAKILILGSFPPPKHRWKMDFYYPNFNNDMWRVFGLVFFGDKDYFVDLANKTFHERKIRDFLHQKGIAIYDTAYRVKRLQGNASDKFLQIVEAVDLTKLLAQIPYCQTIITTGELATQTLLTHFRLPEMLKIGTPFAFSHNGRDLTLWRMPSTSRAYPLKLEQKAEIYRPIFSGSPKH
ncbi:uracil-DNA glycosylase family protein [Alysiella crassa]|uniref:G:T/U mismatch-specific DNA glycosylase n=1 Tax=Alysiella crassa TaxID=153491 RepID=A0A376BVT0_9NEIS|nr:uracil-DNA glycosylase family protein [Alysiella crassa]UOP06397.1 uracil-DNA glycosylase family protein [Alysiella crassa]SSY80915.1 G:T/U mismatch-specific DNA glycosylase [Alysiella crassa]